MSVTVLICAYTEKRWDELAQAVRSAQNQELSPDEVVLVVDYNPALLERARAAFPGVRVVENCETKGLAGARNTGITLAQGEIIAFLDDDAAAAPDWLKWLVAAYEDPRAIGVGGSIEPIWPAGRPAWFPDEFDWVVGCTYRGMPEQAAAVRNLIGANMSFRRKAFDPVRFMSDIGHNGTRAFGGSDPDICIRLTQHWTGRTLLYEPRARVAHQVHPFRTAWRYFVSRCYNEGQSKAVLTGRVGAQKGLSTETRYTFSTLPQGVARGL
ncbi:MAG: glycosyltransferase family 2 protein, partial [Chloroflexota bacterium]